MRIAFYGGSFDPPHRGHLAVARAAIARLALDRVLMAPAAAQPLKQSIRENGGQASFADRLAMVRLAVEGEPHLEASDLDAPLPDGGPNYTIDTLERLRRLLSATDKLFCLVGADSLFTLKKWRRAGELILFCDFIVAGRPGFNFDEIPALLPDGIKQVGFEREPDAICVGLAGGDGGRSTLYLLTGLQEEVSATDIRANLAGGAQAPAVLAPAVAEYIRAHGLYRDLNLSA